MIEGNLAVVKIEGSYSTSKVVFTLQIDSEDIIATNYAVSDFSIEPLPSHELLWNNSCYGGFSEIVVKYELTSEIDRLSWDRKALWSVYPENHIGAPKGNAYKTVQANQNDWGTFTSDKGTFMIFRSNEQPYTNNFRGMKEYIRTATAFAGSMGCGLQVFSPMTDAICIELSSKENGNVEMLINNQWNYPTLGLGNYMKRPIFTFERGFKGVVRMRFSAE